MLLLASPSLESQVGSHCEGILMYLFVLREEFIRTEYIVGTWLRDRLEELAC